MFSMPGIEEYSTQEGFKVLKVHYTADEDKDPSRNGAVWFKDAEKGFVGGRSGAAWRKEMEIDFSAYSGQLLCYDILVRYRHKIIIDKPVLPEDYKYGSLDWGRNNPASFHTYVVDKDKNIHSENEIYLNNISVPEFSDLIKSTKYFNELTWISADPSLFNKTQETKEGLRSMADLFSDEDIFLTRGTSRDDTLAINELLDAWNKLDLNSPKFTISPKCPKQIWEFERLRYKELTTAAFDKMNFHETLVDKDNHAWDDFKYFSSTWISTPTTKAPVNDNPNSAWYKANQIKQRREKYVH